MTAFVKLVSETKIAYAPINKGSIINYNLDTETLIADGYKKLIKCELPSNGRAYVMKYREDATNVYEYIDFIEDEERFNARIQQENYELETGRITSLINDLDIKRIRALCEPSVKNDETGETWLEYYNAQIIELREELKGLINNDK